MIATKTSFAAAMKNFFGLKDGQKLTGPGGFMDELKALDDADRAYFATHLNAAGYQIGEATAA